MSVFANVKNFLPKWLRGGESRVGADRVAQDKLYGAWMHWVTAQSLSRAMEQFTRGDLDRLARIWAEISERDDMLIDVVDKRVSAVAQLPWEIVKEKGDDSPEADAHKEALEFLYNNLTATSVREPEEIGGVTLLLEQMMEATATRYSAHELIWKPEGATLTVQCNHLPLWYFEARTGKLRYRTNLHAYEGQELEPDAWMVTVGRGLIKASCIAYLCKHLPLKDWVIFCDHYGFPGVLGKTDAAYDSPEWKQMVELVSRWKGDRAGVVSHSADIEQKELKAGPTLPYRELVERMDRAMAIMWRGGDLSTLAKGDGVGANPQQEERDSLRNREAARISETLNARIDTPAIRWLFGETPRAWFTLKPPARVQVEQEIKITEHLVKHGVPVGVESEAARFGRSLPDDEEELLAAPAQPAADPAAPPRPPAQRFANAAPSAAMARLIHAIRESLGPAIGRDIGPLFARLDEISDLDDADAFRAALAKWRREAPGEFAAAIKRGPAAAKALQDGLGTAYLNGLLAETPKSPTSGEPAAAAAEVAISGPDATQRPLNAA